MATHKDPTIRKVLDAIEGNPDAVKQLSAALLTRDRARIRDAVSTTTGVVLTLEEISQVLSTMPSDDEQSLAYLT